MKQAVDKSRIIAKSLEIREFVPPTNHADFWSHIGIMSFIVGAASQSQINLFDQLPNSQCLRVLYSAAVNDLWTQFSVI